MEDQRQFMLTCVHLFQPRIRLSGGNPGSQVLVLTAYGNFQTSSTLPRSLEGAVAACCVCCKLGADRQQLNISTMSFARPSLLRALRTTPALTFRPCIRFQSTTASGDHQYQYILTSTPKPGVAQSMQVPKLGKSRGNRSFREYVMTMYLIFRFVSDSNP